ncbi:MAG: hypothetical protein Q8Q23_02010 [bacterium]|nr:hypothetical protein [bacterium]
MYNTITKNQWLKKLQISPTAVPDIFVIHGSMFFNKRVKEIKKFLNSSQVVPDLPIVLGKLEKQKVGISVAYGGPMASEFAHIFSVLGTKVIIQTGTFGGLKSELMPGDCCIPKAVFPGDDASGYYTTKKTVALPTNGQLRNILAEKLQSAGVSYCSGNVFTTAAMLAESERDLQSLQRQGYCGIDLETAAVIAVARSFKIPAAAMLRMGENLALHQNNITDKIAAGATTNIALWHIAITAGIEYVSRNK